MDDTILMPRLCPGIQVDRAVAGSNAAAAVFNTERTHRYLLTRQWADGPTAVIIGMNPSSADARVDDPTTRRCVGLARRQHCGSIALVNLFGLISTDPARLARHPDPVGRYNDEFLRHVPVGQSLVIAAWGVHGARGGRDRQVLEELWAAGVAVLCWGTTRHGHPRHPLYVRGDTPLRGYLAHQPAPSHPRHRRGADREVGRDV